MLPKWLLWSCLPVFLRAASQVIHTEQFDEALSIRPLEDGKIAATFQFTTLLKGATPRNPITLGGDDVCRFSYLFPNTQGFIDTEAQHYTLFPLALGQILREYAVTELHLTLNAGKWRYDRWGLPKEPGVGAGAELWAWMGETATTRLAHPNCAPSNL